MNVQEREELDFYPESAGMLCVHEARRAMHITNADACDKADAYIRAGLFVALCFSPWYCQATDAFVGERITVLGSAFSRREAQRFERDDEEARFEVWPHRAS